jgi:hypothetical protein
MTNPKDTTGNHFVQTPCDQCSGGFHHTRDCPNHIANQVTTYTSTEPTGKRWWEQEIEERFDSSYMPNGESKVKDFIKAFIAKVDKQAYRKGVNDSIGALPELGSTVSMHALRYRKEAKENIGRLIK